jgi:hypothetical protein
MAEATLEPELETADEPQAPPAPAKAPEKPAKAKAAKGKKDAKAAKGKKDAKAPADNGGAPSIVAHPRAARSVARAKSWAGLIGFLIGGYMSWSTASPAEAAAHALIAGIICYVAVWAGAVFAWRRLVMLELKGREQKLVEALERPQLPPGGPVGERANA